MSGTQDRPAGLPAAPEGWTWVSFFGNWHCVRVFGPATARVALRGDNLWRAWSYAYHPDAGSSGPAQFVHAIGGESVCDTFERATTFAEGGARVLEQWISGDAALVSELGAQLAEAESRARNAEARELALLERIDAEMRHHELQIATIAAERGVAGRGAAERATHRRVIEVLERVRG